MEIVEKETETSLVATLLDLSVAYEAMVALLDLLVGMAVSGLLIAEGLGFAVAMEGVALAPKAVAVVLEAADMRLKVPEVEAAGWVELEAAAADAAIAHLVAEVLLEMAQLLAAGMAVCMVLVRWVVAAVAAAVAVKIGSAEAAWAAIG